VAAAVAEQYDCCIPVGGTGTALAVVAGKPVAVRAVAAAVKRQGPSFNTKIKLFYSKENIKKITSPELPLSVEKKPPSSLPHPDLQQHSQHYSHQTVRTEELSELVPSWSA
jgi:hypothetical protein